MKKDSKKQAVTRLCLFLCMVVSMILLSGHVQAAALKTQSAQPGTARPFVVAAESEKRFTLANGLSVYLIRDTRFPMVCTRLYVRTGSSHERPQEFGISHVLEHMVFKGTTSRPKGEIAREVESLGGYLNAYTSFDKTCYLTDMPSRHWQTGIDIVRDMAFHPLLDAGELEKEKPVIISELEGNEDEPSYRLFLDLQKASLAQTPYAHPIIGTRESVRAVTTKALQDYIDRWYQPGNMLLVVAGDIDLAGVQEYVRQSFASLANRDEFAAENPIDVQSLKSEKERVAVTHGKWNKVYLGLAVAVPGVKDYASLNLDLLSYVLAGDGTSYFERKYRHDQQLVDSISVSNMSFSRLGLFSIMAVLDADKVEPFFTQLVRDLAGLNVRNFTDAELQRAKFNMEDAYDRSSETLNGLASWRAQMEFEMGGRQGEANMRLALRALDYDDIEATYRQYIHPEAVTVRVLAPEQAKLPDLAAILNREWPAAKTATSAVSAAQKIAREQIRLDNGVELVLLPDTTIPYVSVSMMSTGGNALQTTEEGGLATLTANLLTDGCGDMDRVTFEKRLAEKALAIGTKTGRQSFAINGTGPARYTADLLGLMKEVYTAPRFEKKEFVRERKDMESARVLRDDDPMGKLSARLWPTIFGSHPYGQDPLGTKESLARLTPASAADFWARQKARPWVVVFAGTFDREEVLAWAGSLPKASARAVEVKAPVWSKDKSLTLQVPDKNKAHLVELYPTVAQTHADAPALMLLQAVLSGQSGLLFAQMRDKDSIGYTVAAQNVFFPETGLTLFYTGTSPDRIEAARQGFARILDDLKKKDLPPALLEAGCNVLEGKYIRSRQSLSSRASEAAREVLLDLPVDYARTLIEKTRTLTPQDLRTVVTRYFHDGYTAVARP